MGNQGSNLKNAHSKTAEDVLQSLEVSGDQGLTVQEVQGRQKKYGRNELEKHEEKSIWKILLDQLNNPVIYLLTAATVIAFVFGDVPEGVAIIVVILFNTIIGFWMEYQARQSMNALKEMDKVTVEVLRDGKEEEVDAEGLVPGDIILLEAGSLVPADGRVIKQSELTIDESPLTGESIPVSKSIEGVEEGAQVGDRTSMVFKGTAVTNGTAKVVVTSTGMDTEIGDISAMVGSAEKEQVPLNRKLQGLTKMLIWVTLGLAALFFLFGWIAGKEIYELVQTAIAWTIAAIPEGLPIVASIALAKGMLRLAKHNVIVKRLAAVETLGEITVMFTDKTGTLTENDLTVDKLLFDGGKATMSGGDEQFSWEFEEGLTEEDPRMAHFFEIGVICNDASLGDDEDGGKGDPLDLALLKYAKSYDPERYKQLQDQGRLAEEPFDSEDMVQGTVVSLEGDVLLAAKGASEPIINRCSAIITAEGAETFDAGRKEAWKDYNNELSNDGLRVIAFARKVLNTEPNGDQNVEEELMQDMEFLGLVGFIDPPRKGIQEAVSICKEAGIKVEMVTGDHPGTAGNIARQVAITDEGTGEAMHGQELATDDDAQKERIVNTRVFARVDPKQKLDLIQYNQEKGHIVGMTGDGVNDAPALKKADIGIAMGQRGTQVAQEVADIVLKDDSFPAIVEAIREGRIIFGNIRKFIMYQLSYHLSEILVIASISFTVFNLALLPLQLLFLNLLSDVFPALALGIGKGRKEVMKDPPKDPQEPIINNQNWFLIGCHGAILTLYVVGAYFLALKGWGLSKEICNNVAFLSLGFAQLWHVFDMREADEPIFNNQVTRNKFVWMALAFCVSVFIASFFIPGLKDVLSYQSLSMKTWILIGVASLMPMITIQALKQVTRGMKFKL